MNNILIFLFIILIIIIAIIFGFNNNKNKFINNLKNISTDTVDNIIEINTEKNTDNNTENNVDIVPEISAESANTYKYTVINGGSNTKKSNFNKSLNKKNKKIRFSNIVDVRQFDAKTEQTNDLKSKINLLS